jgi:hypothetical protein
MFFFPNRLLMISLKTLSHHYFTEQYLHIQLKSKPMKFWLHLMYSTSNIQNQFCYRNSIWYNIQRLQGNIMLCRKLHGTNDSNIWSNVLLEKLIIITQLLKKRVNFLCNRKFLPCSQKRHRSYLKPTWIQSTLSHPISCRSILVVSSHLYLYFPLSLTFKCFNQNSVCTSCSLHELHSPPTFWFGHPCNIWWWAEVMK